MSKSELKREVKTRVVTGRNRAFHSEGCLVNPTPTLCVLKEAGKKKEALAVNIMRNAGLCRGDARPDWCLFLGVSATNCGQCSKKDIMLTRGFIATCLIKRKMCKICKIPIVERYLFNMIFVSRFAFFKDQKMTH